jgi:hypothetical protein
MFQSTAERSALSVVAERWAVGFAFDYGICLATAEGSNVIENLATGRPLAPFGQSAYESRKVCGVMALITSFVFATLPFLTMYIAARVGIAGGWRARFTLWLRGWQADLRALMADSRGGFRFGGSRGELPPQPSRANPHEPPSPKPAPKGEPHPPESRPNSRGEPSNGEPHPEPKPKDDPCQDSEGGGSEEQGPPTDPYPPAVHQLEDNLAAARAAEKQAWSEYEQAARDFLAQKLNKPDIAAQWDPRNGPNIGDPSKFDQVAYDNAKTAIEQAWKNFLDKESAAFAAQEAYDDYMAQLGRQARGGGGQGGEGGRCGGSSNGSGSDFAGQSPANAQPQNASPNAQQSGTGPAQQANGPWQSQANGPQSAPDSPPPRVQIQGDSRNPYANTQVTPYADTQPLVGLVGALNATGGGPK